MEFWCFRVCGLSSFAFGLVAFFGDFGCWGVRFGYFMCWCFVFRVERLLGLLVLGRVWFGFGLRFAFCDWVGLRFLLGGFSCLFAIDIV